MHGRRSVLKSPDSEKEHPAPLFCRLNLRIISVISEVLLWKVPIPMTAWLVPHGAVEVNSEGNEAVGFTDAWRPKKATSSGVWMHDLSEPKEWLNKVTAPHHQSSSVTADALKASFTPSDGNYFALDSSSHHALCFSAANLMNVTILSWRLAFLYPIFYSENTILSVAQLWIFQDMFLAFASIRFYKLTLSPGESPACLRRPPAFTLLLAAVSVTVVMMLLTSAAMTVWGHIESPHCWFQCDFWEDVWCLALLSFLEDEHVCVTSKYIWHKMRKLIN